MAVGVYSSAWSTYCYGWLSSGSSPSALCTIGGAILSIEGTRRWHANRGTNGSSHLGVIAGPAGGMLVRPRRRLARRAVIRGREAVSQAATEKRGRQESREWDQPREPRFVDRGARSPARDPQSCHRRL